MYGRKTKAKEKSIMYIYIYIWGLFCLEVTILVTVVLASSIETRKRKFPSWYTIIIRIDRVTSKHGKRNIFILSKSFLHIFKPQKFTCSCNLIIMHILSKREHVENSWLIKLIKSRVQFLTAILKHIIYYIYASNVLKTIW